MALPIYASPFQKTWYYTFRVICALVFFFLVFPIMVIIPLSFNAQDFFTFTPEMLALKSEGFSLKHYQDFFTNDDWQHALRNSLRIAPMATVLSVSFEPELQTIVVRTDKPTNYETKLQKKTQTSGCAVGTLFGDIIETLEGLTLPNSKVSTSWLYSLTKQINQMPSLYLSAGAIHGTVLCKENQPLVYMEDVGRHNAVDKVAGWMRGNQISGADKIMYTTGRLTSEMVIKCALMGIPVLVSRSGFTAWGVELADQVGLTLIGRMRGQRFQCLAGSERLIYDRSFEGEEENQKHRRKSAQ